MLYSSEQTHASGHPVHVEATRRLREAAAGGATALRGIWGYHGDHLPHGDSFWSLKRRVPTLTVVVDRPTENQGVGRVARRDHAERGLITSEMVPAFRAAGPDMDHGGLRLALLSRGGRR